MIDTSIQRIVAVALNPAIDRVVEAANLAIGAHQVIRTLGRHAGGKAVNVARALSLLEVPSVLTGLVGLGEREFFGRNLEGGRVEMRLVPVAGQTRENITLVDPATRVETHLRDRGFEVSAGEQATLRKELASLAGPGVLFVFSGSLPPGITPADQAEMLAACRQAGGRVAVDLSGPALPPAVAAQPWLIKPNRQELGELLGGPLQDREALLAGGRRLAQSVPIVLTSDGAAGAYLLTSAGTWHGRCPLPPERVISTVGCGDTLLAGLLAGFYRKMSMPESLRLAVAAAAATAANLAATFEAGQVERLLPQAEVRPIAATSPE